MRFSKVIFLTLDFIHLATMNIRLTILFLCFTVCTFTAGAQKTYPPLTQNIQTTDSLMSLFMHAATVDSLLYIEDVCPEIDTTGRKTLFLIHGWSFDGVPAKPGGGYWNYFREYIRNNPELRDSYKPYYVRYWSNYVPVNQIAAELRRKVEEAGFNKKRIVIMAHSMGGLVSRSYMEEQRFTDGPRKGEKCGVLVDQLITLGTPHHGSPMANRYARDDFYSWLYKQVLGQVEKHAFKDLTYDKVNRSDLRWDNYNNLMNYSKYPNEANPWLIQLNNQSTFHPKITCYSGTTNGQFTIPDTDDIDEVYSFLAFMQDEGFDYPNDGIVPTISAQFDEKTVKKIRHFPGYNHAELNYGKEGQREVLFDFFKIDLDESKPLKLTQPGMNGNEFLPFNQTYNIKWVAPNYVQKVNIYFSPDNGNTFTEIARNIDATSGSYTWIVPDYNADNCRIKISDADFEYEYAVSTSAFTVYNNKANFDFNSNSYLVNYRTDTINWQYEGMRCTANLRYHDLNNDTLIAIADSLDMRHREQYTIVWPADTSLAATSRAVFEIELLDMNERYHDTATYILTSGEMPNLGKPSVQINTPSTYPKSSDQIWGERYEVGSSVYINFEYEGEIKHFELYACDSNYVVYDTVFTGVAIPDVLRSSFVPWQVPDFRNDKLYFYIKAGVSADSILVEDYSDYSFRVNYRTRITKPFGGQLDAPLLPCFEVEKLEGIENSVFEIQSLDTPGPSPVWHEANSAEYCVANQLENELEPGMRYQLSAKSKIDERWTYPDTIIFTAEASQPYDVVITSPAANDTIEGDSMVVQWSRAVGADQYRVELVQGDLFFESEALANTDTSIIIDITNLPHYTYTDVIVYAINNYGQSTDINTIVRKFKTNTDDIEIEPRIYPNPVSINGKTIIELETPDKTSQVELILFDLSGKKIASHSPVLQGHIIYQLSWQQLVKNTNIETGVYFLQIETLNDIDVIKVVVME